MWRVGILDKNGNAYGQSFEDRESAEAWILEEAEKGIAKAILQNIETKERETYEF